MNGYDYVIWQPQKLRLGPPRFVRAADCPWFGFCSIYQVDEETAQTLSASGTTAGFKGVVWSERLWIDIDSNEAAQAVKERLYAQGLDLVVYDTGNRGLHFGILRSCPPSRALPGKDKTWVSENVPEADLSLYSHLHLLRRPGARHEKTGRRKHEIARRRGSALDLSRLEVKEPRSVVEGFNEQRARTSIFKDFLVTKYSQPNRSTDARPVDGSRHQQLVNLCFSLKNRGESPDIAFWWICNVLSSFREPKYNEGHVEKIIESVYRST